MDSSVGVSDPSDWKPTAVPRLSDLDSSLRCRVCKDFFITPMITSCSHTFCSLCIRRCLTEDGCCPACRTPDQMTRLRLNVSMMEALESFQKVRSALLEACKAPSADQNSSTRLSHKRKASDEIADGEEPDMPGRKLRASSRVTRRAVPLGTVEQEAQIISDVSEEDGDLLASCPICGQRMKEREVFSHLDVHSESKGKSEPSRTNGPLLMRSASGDRGGGKSMERLPQLNYSLLKDLALRKKMSDLGIATHGSRATLIKRHTEWVNLVNANCDSQRPRGRRDLLQELDVWDRAQNRPLPAGTVNNGAMPLMHKDFDGHAWAGVHRPDFKRLIDEARRKHLSTKPDVG